MWLLYVPFALLSAYVLYHRFIHPLAKVPGPALAGITPLWLAWQGMHQRRPALDLQLHKKYGSVVRIAPNEVIFSNPAYFNTVYGAGASKVFAKGRFYEAPTPASTTPAWEQLDMLPEKDMDKLRLQKRLIGPVYSTANTVRHEQLIDHNLQRWLNRLSTLASGPVDLYYEFELLNVDLMCELTFAQPFGAVEKGSDGEHMHTMNSVRERPLQEPGSELIDGLLDVGMVRMDRIPAPTELSGQTVGTMAHALDFGKAKVASVRSKHETIGP